MNAQNIIKIIKELNPSGFDLHLQYSVLPDNMSIFHQIYEAAREAAPCDAYRNGTDREFWLWTDRGSFEEFTDTFHDHFTYVTIDTPWEYEKEFRIEEARKQWPLYFPDGTAWFKLYLAEYYEDRSLWLGGRKIIDTKEQKHSRSVDAGPLLEWILDSVKTCIDMIREGTYSAFVAEHLPYRHRSGMMKMSDFWKYLPQHNQRLFGSIDPEEFDAFKRWDETEDNGWEAMSVNDYFRICDCLYDLVGVKEKYPGKITDPTPREAYLTYAANYNSAKSFLALDADSPEVFADFLENKYTEHHTWEVCLAPNIHLYPKRRNGKTYINVCFDHKVTEYDKLIHLTLSLREAGFPIIKPTHILKRLKGEETLGITPQGDEFNYKYIVDNNYKINEYHRLPLGAPLEMLDEITWLPVDEWHLV